MTAAAAMYYTNIDYATEKSMHVIKSRKLREQSKDLLFAKQKQEHEEKSDYGKKSKRYEKNRFDSKSDTGRSDVGRAISGKSVSDRPDTGRSSGKPSGRSDRTGRSLPDKKRDNSFDSSTTLKGRKSNVEKKLWKQKKKSKK